jgi:hypothetical protein
MMLPIDSNDEGHREIHHTRIYRKMRRWQADGRHCQVVGSVT